MSYSNWKARLEIAKLPTVAARRAELSRLKLANMEPTIEDEGYYRIPITQKDASGNGRNIVTGYIPVAIWSEGRAFGNVESDVLVGVRGVEQEEMSSEQIVDQWTWFCAHPVSYELYKEVAEDGGLWPDIPVGPTTLPMIEPAVPAANREVAKTDNAPPPEVVVPPEVEHATAIDNAIAAAPKAVTSEAEDAIASGSKNRIAELRLAATRVGEAAYKPPYNEYKRLHGIWTPMVARAERKEKELNTAILSFRESERKKAAAAAAEAARLQQIQDEANERAAQRAIARGEPEDAPPVVEAAPALPPAPAPVQPTYGTRQVKAEPKIFLQSIEDWEALFRHFKDDMDVRRLLATLALAKARNGLTVPGITTTEALIAPEITNFKPN